MAKGVSMTTRRQKWLTVCALGIAYVIPVSGWCQRPGTTRTGSPGRHELDAAQLLRRLDHNQDGLLQREEIPRRVWPQVELAARQRGLDTKKPLPLSELARSIKPRRADPGEPAKPTPKDTNTNSEDGSEPSVQSDGNASSLVPGFGVPDNRPPVTGFDVPLSGTRVQRTESPEEGKGSKASTASTSAANSQVRRYAKSMLAQYDKNKNGQLEKEEWSRLRGKPKEADRNGDDVLSLDELSEHLAGYGSRRDTVSGSRSRAGGKSSYRSSKPHGTNRSSRFLSPHERLPKGLPDWFPRKDADLDGQISMGEFSTVWSRGKLKEFTDWDLNGDGLIVPKECLRATTREKRLGRGQ